MDTPFANAAKRGWAFIAVPITLARISPDPNDSTYFRAIGPITDADPASANPKPSRIDFFPSSITSGGMSSYFVLMMNSATDLVSPGAFGNSVAAAGAGEASARCPARARADAASEVLNKSRRFMSAVLVSLLDSILRGSKKRRQGTSINMRDVFRADFLPHIRGQLVEQENRLLPPLVRVFRFRIVLVAPNHEAIRKIHEKLQPLGFDFAVKSQRVSLSVSIRIGLDLHIQIWMRQQQMAVEIDRSKSGEVRPEMRPDHPGARIVRQESFERGNVGMQPRRIGRRLQVRRKRHILWHRLHVDVNGDVMLRGQICEQQVERMVRRRSLVWREAIEMLGRHLAETDHALAQQFLGARFKFFLDFRPRIACGHGLD